MKETHTLNKRSFYRWESVRYITHIEYCCNLVIRIHNNINKRIWICQECYRSEVWID